MPRNCGPNRTTTKSNEAAVDFTKDETKLKDIINIKRPRGATKSRRHSGHRRHSLNVVLSKTSKNHDAKAKVGINKSRKSTTYDEETEIEAENTHDEEV